MDKYFASLESKVERVIAQCDWLRAENQGLRQELVERNEELRVMAEKMEEARRRLQNLVAQVPEQV
ncbi:MAG: hypothetical protein G3I09_08805 [Ferrovum sp.]|jgi:hypothetical protein|nr:hypothetical protein [Ferrovum sp.]